MSYASALSSVLRWEGIYDNDPNDTGGETCFGITRKYQPEWDGWVMVDALKAHKVPVNEWSNNAALMESVSGYYRGLWDKLNLDPVAYEALSESVFGCAVNQGPVRAVRMLQQSLNDCGEMVEVDGLPGPGTSAAVGRVSDRCLGDALLGCYKARRAKAYLEAATSRAGNGKFLVGWLNRLFGGA
jgi:lysozyme family protein